MDDMKQAVIYIRVSTEEQAKHGHSIEAQKKHCNDYALKMGFVIAKIFVDEGLSAKNLNRPEVKQMLMYCDSVKNKVDAIIVWKLDRLSRDNTDYHAVLKPLCFKNNISILSATESNDSSIQGELMRNIGINFAEYERKLIGLRTEVGMKAKADKGQFPAKAPLGYKNVEGEGGNRTIVVDDRNAFFIKKAFNLYLTGEYSFRKLGKVLGAEGFVDKHGKSYPPRKFEHILKNIFYTGQFMWDKVTYQGNHMPLITKDVFYAVQSRFDNSLKARKHDIQFPYTNLIKCAKCGCYLTAELHRGRQGKGEYIYYHCTGTRGGKCKSKYVRQEVIDKTFENLIENLYLPDELVETITKKMKEYHIRKSEYQNNSIDAVQNQINVLKNRLDNLLIQNLDGKISDELWQEKHNEWTNQKNQLIMQLDAIYESDAKYYENLNLLLKFCRNAPQLYKEANSEQKRIIIGLACLKLFYNGSTLDIELRTVFENIRIIPKCKNGADDGVRTHVYRYHKPRS